MRSLSRRHLLSVGAAGLFSTQVNWGRTLWAKSRQDEPAAKDLPFLASPLVSLVRDPGVQQELAVTDAQRPRIETATSKVDLPLFLLRDVPPSQGADKYHQLVGQLEADLRQILQPDQYQRLSELVIRAQGFPALIQPKNAQELQLEPQQTQKIQAVLEGTQRDLQQAMAAGKNHELAAINERARKRIEETLTSGQRQRLAKLVGQPFDLSKVRQVACAAPELKKIERWHNTGALSMEQLKGKVVALHFYAFG